jgi:hypothetical protein
MPSYQATVMADGPFAYWRLNLNANDSVGTNGGGLNPGATANQPNGPLLGGTSLCTVFSATGSVTLPALPTTAAMTLEAWIKYTTTAQMPLWSNRPVGGATGEYIGFQGAGLFWYNGGSTPASALAGAYNDGAWHHVAWITNGSVVTIMVDGVVSSINGVAFTHPATAANSTYIGWDKPNNAEYYQGSLAEVALYNKALTTTQVAAHYAARNNPSVSGGAMLAVF